MTDRRIEIKPEDVQEIKPEDVQAGDWVELEGYDDGEHWREDECFRVVVERPKAIRTDCSFWISRRNIVRAWREAPERRVANIEYAPGRPCRVSGLVDMDDSILQAEDSDAVIESKRVREWYYVTINGEQGHTHRRNVDLIERRRKDGGAR